MSRRNTHFNAHTHSLIPQFWKLTQEIVRICKKVLTALFTTGKKLESTQMPTRGPLTLYGVIPSHIFKISICMHRKSSRRTRDKLLMAVVSAEWDCQVETPFPIFNAHSFILSDFFSMYFLTLLFLQLFPLLPFLQPLTHFLSLTKETRKWLKAA